jgi:hypothetical protein
MMTRTELLEALRNRVRVRTNMIGDLGLLELILKSLSETHQSKVTAWAHRIFGYQVASNVPERSLRFVEEATELAQACGSTREELHRLIDYVYARPVGEPAKEIAGSLVTLYVLASALDVDVDEVVDTELVRINTPEVIERVLRRQKEKREVTAGK